MQLGLLKILIVAFLALTLLAGASAFGGSATKRTPVEVWRGGDDGLTVRLCDAIEARFRESPDFILRSRSGKEGLIVTIPTNAEWKYINRRMKVFYVVQFSSAGSKIKSHSKGSCWEDRLTDCADQIVRKARSAVRKVR